MQSAHEPTNQPTNKLNQDPLIHNQQTNGTLQYNYKKKNNWSINQLCVSNERNQEDAEKIVFCLWSPQITLLIQPCSNLNPNCSSTKPDPPSSQLDPSPQKFPRASGAFPNLTNLPNLTPILNISQQQYLRPTQTFPDLAFYSYL